MSVRRSLSLLAAIAVVAGAASARGQTLPRRPPTDRQVLTQLAYTLGEAHALHRLCAGPSDATWYGRMRQLISAEAPDEGFRRRLVESFNAGYQTRVSQYPGCSRDSQAAERQAAAHGAALARTLSSGRGSE